MPSPAADFSALLIAARRGGNKETGDLFSAVYEDLHRLARAQRRFGGASCSLKTMRQILFNDARKRLAVKRGGDCQKVRLEDVALSAMPHAPEQDLDELIALDQALTKLEHTRKRQRRIVECRFFCGLSVTETAATLGLSPATVKRDWCQAIVWLRQEIETRPT